MQNKTDFLKKTLWIILLLLLTFPLFQRYFKMIEIAPLNGDIEIPINKWFTIDGWFSNDYQESEEKYINETFGFRNWFIRVHNQINFTLFKKVSAKKVVVGKENYLFEDNYITNYYGIGYEGENAIRERIEKVKYIHEEFSKVNKTIVLVLASGKGTYYPEYFPKSFITEKGTSNLETFVEISTELDIPFINFNQYFVDNKHISPYPLYPKYGVHWSFYGSCIAADSIIKYVEREQKINMPNFYWTEITMQQPKGVDYDLADGINILRRLKSFEMAYPNIQVESDSGKITPSALVVGDSFFWDMYYFGFFKSFSNNLSHFWYYNEKIYPENSEYPTTSSICFSTEIDKHDVIILLATESNVGGIGWWFIEKLYDLLKSREQ